MVPLLTHGTIQWRVWSKSKKDQEKGSRPIGSRAARTADCKVVGLYLQPKSNQDGVELDFWYHGGNDW